MPKFRLIFLLSIAIICSGYKWRCYAFCDDQTAIQNDYVENRDECREFAQDNVDAEMAKAANPNSVKARKAKLVTLFSDCMAKYGWDVPRGSDKGGKDNVADADNGLETLRVSPENNTGQANNIAVIQKDLPVRKTPVENVEKQNQQKTFEQNKSTKKSVETNKSSDTRASAKKSASRKKQSGATKTQDTQTRAATNKKNTLQQENQAATETVKEPVKSYSRETSTTTTNSTSKNIVQESGSKQQSPPPAIVPQHPNNSTSYMRSINNKNTATKQSEGENTSPANEVHTRSIINNNPASATATDAKNAKETASPAYLYNKDSQQPPVNTNNIPITNQTTSGNSVAAYKETTKEKETVEKIITSKQTNNTENVTTTTNAATMAPQTAGITTQVVDDESNIPVQPRVTNSSPAKQRASECEIARRSANVSQLAAKKAKECDIECDKLRRTMPRTINPAPCPAKDSAVNVLDRQLQNKQ